jgi:hypothetical protein
VRWHGSASYDGASTPPNIHVTLYVCQVLPRGVLRHGAAVTRAAGGAVGPQPKAPKQPKSKSAIPRVAGAQPNKRQPKKEPAPEAATPLTEAQMNSLPPEMQAQDRWDDEELDKFGDGIKNWGLFFVVFAAVGAGVVAANTYNDGTGLHSSALSLARHVIRHVPATSPHARHIIHHTSATLPLDSHVIHFMPATSPLASHVIQGEP